MITSNGVNGNGQKEQPVSPGASQGGQIQIKATDEVLKGFYANVALIHHTPEEFVLDFMSIFANSPSGTLGSRVVLSPGHMKRIVLAMQDNLKRYEEQFGNIKPSEAPKHKFGFDTDKSK